MSFQKLLKYRRLNYWNIFLTQNNNFRFDTISLNLIVFDMYLKSLFKYLRKNYNTGVTSLTFDQISNIVGKELCDGAKSS